MHNGIIEDFGDYGAELEGDGVKFSTRGQFSRHPPSGDEGNRTRHVCGEHSEDDTAAAARRLHDVALAKRPMFWSARAKAPLAVGFGDGTMYVGSNAIALAPFTDQVAIWKTAMG